VGLTAGDATADGEGDDVEASQDSSAETSKKQFAHARPNRLGAAMPLFYAGVVVVVPRLPRVATSRG
jgi:hypothetical protein